MQSLRKAIVALALMLFVITPVFAGADAPDGTLTFSGGRVAAGIGYSWGSGTLHFHGKDYPFKVKGLTVLDVGAAHIEGDGEVYHLTKVEDFAGNYSAFDAGLTLAVAGGSRAALKNENGVVVHFHSNTEGLQLNLGTNGVDVTLKK